MPLGLVPVLCSLMLHPFNQSAAGWPLTGLVISHQPTAMATTKPPFRCHNHSLQPPARGFTSVRYAPNGRSEAFKNLISAPASGLRRYVFKEAPFVQATTRR